MMNIKYFLTRTSLFVILCTAGLFANAQDVDRGFQFNVDMGFGNLSSDSEESTERSASWGVMGAYTTQQNIYMELGVHPTFDVGLFIGLHSVGLIEKRFMLGYVFPLSEHWSFIPLAGLSRGDLLIDEGFSEDSIEQTLSDNGLVGAISLQRHGDFWMQPIIRISYSDFNFGNMSVITAGLKFSF